MFSLSVNLKVGIGVDIYEMRQKKNN